VDVLKVPHHGSRYQDLPFLQSLHARLAVISVGADTVYGHPAPQTVDGLAATGEKVLRTDRDGSIAVVERDGRLAAVTTR
jgi:competence protein ComEC